MRPFGPMFSGGVYNVAMFAITCAMTLVLTRYMCKRLVTRGAAAVTTTYFIASVYSLILINGIIALLQLVGLVSMILNIVSWMWFVWELLFLISVGMIFRHLPLLMVIVLAWGLVQWWQGRVRARSLSIGFALLAAFALNAGLFFAIDAYARSEVDKMDGPALTDDVG